MIGQTLNNRYTVTARLGKGAMGTVYRATDSQTGQEVAVKVIARELASDNSMLERFKREGQALHQLRHPNIVGFVDAFQHDEQYIIVMEYVPGGSLSQLIKQGPLPVERGRQIALDLCDALIRAHRLNIIHRDLKPENILIAEDGTPKLTDFGVAKLLEGSRLTGTGTQVGTPYYMSPEAWEGKPLDAQADIWSLGIVFYEMLSGEVPFGGDTMVAVMNKVLTARLPDLKVKRPEVPGSLISIVNRMLTRSKDKRYQTIREASLDIERSELRGTPKPLPPPKRRVPGWAWIGITSLVILAVTAVLLGGGILAAQLSRQQTVPSPAIVPTDSPATATTATTQTSEPKVAYRWDFDSDAEGWSQIASFSQDSQGEIINNGHLIMVSLGGTYLFSPVNLSIDAAEVSILEFSMLVTGQTQGGRIYFTTATEQGLSETRMVSFDLVTSKYYLYQIDMAESSNWQGTITRLIIQPITEANSRLGLDYVLVRSSTNSNSQTTPAPVSIIEPQAATQTYFSSLTQTAAASQATSAPTPNSAATLLTQTNTTVVVFASQTAVVPTQTYTVLANKAWQDTGITVNAGEVIVIRYVSGLWRWTGDRVDYDGKGDPVANGTYLDICTTNYDCPITDAPLIALVGRVGVSGTPFLIGNSLTFTVPSGAGNDQQLYLMGNDSLSGLYDNVGSIEVSIAK